MNEDNLIIMIPKDAESEINIDFLFADENYKTINIDEEVKYEFLLDDIDDISCTKKEGKIYYHIDLVRKYLERNNPKLSKKLGLKRFNPNNEFELYKILSRYGFTTIMNSDGFSIMFLPEELSPNQKRCLNMLKSMMNGQVFQIIQDNYEVMDTYFNYDEMANFLELDNRKKGLR